VYIKPIPDGADMDKLFCVTLADGTARILGSLVVWLAALVVAEYGGLPQEAYDDPVSVAAMTSLFKIPVLQDAAGLDIVESRIGSVARQNQNAKVSSVSSFQWAAMLLSLGTGQVTLTQAMQKYKDRSSTFSTRRSSCLVPSLSLSLSRFLVLPLVEHVRRTPSLQR